MAAKKKIHKKRFILSILIVLIILLGPIALFQLYFWDDIYPGVKVAGIDLSRETIESGSKKLEKTVTPVSEITITAGGEQKFTIPVNSIELTYDHSKTAQKAYLVGRSGNIIFDFKNIIETLSNGKNLGFEIEINEEKLDTNINVVATSVEIDPIYPTAKLEADKIVIVQGKSGVEIDKRKLRTDIGSSLAYLNSAAISVDKREVNPQLTASQELDYKNRLEKLKNKTLKLTFDPKDSIFESFDYSKGNLINFINPYGGYNEEVINIEIIKISEKVNRQPQNPVFEFSDGKVKEFQPAKDGIAVSVSELKKVMTQNIDMLLTEDTKEKLVSVPVEKTKSAVQTSEVNNLGVVELIGRGTSSYRGSIPSRVFNVSHATGKIHGTLVKPGETFSFNTVLGDISKATGFKEAYVIQNGRTVLGDGGGVCQVSTTLFRAAMNAGLPIIERHNHSYRVGYYEQDAGPGLDATVFSPTADFKFKNDTAGHILVQARADSKNLTLVFELYGTADGRVASVTKPKFISQTPAPGDIYQDDPTLPIGTIKQVEHRAAGAKTSFDYVVVRDGQETYRKTFISTYKPWAAVYLRGTGI